MAMINAAVFTYRSPVDARLIDVKIVFPSQHQYRVHLPRKNLGDDKRWNLGIFRYVKAIRTVSVV
jgi:hypothetical protein